MSHTAPSWFRQAIETPFRTLELKVEGAVIRSLAWGEPEKPGVMLVHGGLAHAHWWRFIAPLLAGDRYVVAPDLSGHGDSDRRDRYPSELWARELKALREAFFADNPILVGHSMGGIVGLAAMALFGDRFDGAVAIDAPIHKPIRGPEEGGGRSFKHIRPYPSLAEAVGRYRFLPDQPLDRPYIKDFLARASLRQVEGGWVWKFDLAMFEKMAATPIEPYFQRIAKPWAFFRGKHSEVVPPEAEQALNTRFGRPMPFVEIPEARHHLTLDQPLAFVAALRSVLALWASAPIDNKKNSLKK